MPDLVGLPLLTDIVKRVAVGTAQKLAFESLISRVLCKVGLILWIADTEYSNFNITQSLAAVFDPSTFTIDVTKFGAVHYKLDAPARLINSIDGTGVQLTHIVSRWLKGASSHTHGRVDTV